MKHQKKNCGICSPATAVTLAFQILGKRMFYAQTSLYNYSILFAHVSISTIAHLTQESEGPYPWPSPGNGHTSQSQKRCQNGTAKSMVLLPKHGVPLDKVHSWLTRLPPSLRSVPGLKDVLLEALSMGCIDFRLPPMSSTSGVVLVRAIGCMESMFNRHYPCIFKVGYTHNAVHRWSNSIWGYSSSRDKWSNMCVLYMSEEPFSVSMFEAALIEKYRGILPIYIYVIIFVS